MNKELISRYKRLKYTRTIKNLYLTHESIDESKSWYYKAHSICMGLAFDYNTTTEVVAGIISAISPGCSFPDNIKQAINILESDNPAKVVITSYPANLLKAIQIKNGMEPLDVLGGQKVLNFYSLLLNPYNNMSVCIDSHIINSLHNKVLSESERQKFFRSSRYTTLVNIFNKTAKELNLLGHELQAIVWIQWKVVINSRSNAFYEPF